MVTGTEVEAHELELFVNHDRLLNQQQGEPTIRNLVRKKARGVYNSSKAEKAYFNLATEGARRYGKEHGSSASDGLQIFSPTVRRMVARELRDAFEAEFKLGNYNHYLPKYARSKAVQAVLE